MDKYRVFETILKTKGFSFYKAEHSQTRELATIKKLHQETNWEELLRNKNIALMNHPQAKYLAPIKEILKDDTHFYCVFQHLDHNLELVIRGELTKEEIFKISRTIIQMTLQFTELKVLPRQIRPSSLFTSNHYLTLKMAHLETATNTDLSKLDLVELQDLRYSSPESVLTSKELDQRALIFGAGLLISELILGRALLSANTKMSYMFQLTKLFPEQELQGGESGLVGQASEEERFQKVLGQYDFSNQFISLLREMLRIDRNERMLAAELLEAFDLIVANEEQFIKDTQAKNMQAQQTVKPNLAQAPINNQVLQAEIELDFQLKPTLSTPPSFKVRPSTLPIERNIDDDAAQPIIIKQSSKATEGRQGYQGQSMPVSLLKDGKGSRTTKQQTISTTKRPQLTNYALNEGSNLGVKLGFHPTLFSEHQNDF